MKKLLIVESPTKSRTISQYLKGVKVIASFGHIKDLPTSRLGVDVENGFTPKYKIIKGKEKVVKEIKKNAKDADEIYLGTDPDREGEAIAYHIAQEIKNDNVKRVLMYEMTKDGVRKAFNNSGSIDYKRVNSQMARRILDRLVGYMVSPILWKVIRRGLSAGRVQSVALRFICEREEAIENFKPKEYWVVIGIFISDNNEFTLNLSKIDNKKPEISSEKIYQEIKDEMLKQAFSIVGVKSSEVKKRPPPPYITSSLQQDASRFLNFSAKQTMATAQKLFEGVELGGGGQVGLITYMRTDAVRVSEKAKKEAKKYIKDEFGAEFIPDKPYAYKSKASSQGAHEAIRPTSVGRNPDVVKQYLKNNEYRLYKLIWKRFLASQMAEAKYKVITLKVKGGKFLFQGESRKIVFPGYRKIFSEREEEVKELPLLKKGEEVKVKEIKGEQKFTQPKPRYTEGTLIKELEAKGIGRPSTYAPIVSTILDRGYIKKEKGYLYPLELGRKVNKILVEKFPEIFNEKFTAKIEKELDDVEGGKKEWKKVIEDFFLPFSKKLKDVEENIDALKKTFEQPTGEKCPVCSAPLVMKEGRYGKFISCSRYPECKYRKPLEEEVLDEKCPVCGAPLIIRRGRYGKFIACSQYPKCKYTKPYSLGIKCSRCDGEILERVSKKGKVYYPCSNPECKEVYWYKPVLVKCEKCGHPFMLLKRYKGKEYLECPECKYRKK